MFISNLLKEKHMSKYRLAKLADVPYSTISDLCAHRSSLNKCNVLTVYKIAKVLKVRIDDLIEEEPFSFDLFKSEICQYVKRVNDLNFISKTLETKVIRKYFDNKEYSKAFYLLAMVDYLSRLHHIPLCSDYDDIRKMKLKEPIYPSSVLILDKVLNKSQAKKKAYQEAIPEFRRFNIIESEIRNVR